jgi:hypothetical protein
MLRMHMVNEAVRAMATAGLINSGNAPALQTTGNEAILRGAPDWFERFQSNLSAAAGFDADQWQRFFDDFLAASDAIRYVHIGNPETIIVTSQELVEQVHHGA